METPKEATQDFEHLKEEIADVLIYSYMLADWVLILMRS